MYLCVYTVHCTHTNTNTHMIVHTFFYNFMLILAKRGSLGGMLPMLEINKCTIQPNSLHANKHANTHVRTHARTDTHTSHTHTHTLSVCVCVDNVRNSNSELLFIHKT